MGEFFGEELCVVFSFWCPVVGEVFCCFLFGKFDAVEQVSAGWLVCHPKLTRTGSIYYTVGFGWL